MDSTERRIFYYLLAAALLPTVLLAGFWLALEWFSGSRAGSAGWLAGLVLGTPLLAVFLARAVAGRLGRELQTPWDRLAATAEQLVSQGTVSGWEAEGPEALVRLAAALRELEGQTHLQRRQAQEQQAFLDAVIRQIPEGLLVLDERGLVTRANEAAERLLESTAARISGRPVLASLISYPVDAEVRRVLEGGPGGAVDLTTPRGTALRVAVGPLQVGGQRAGALVLLHDVSELRRVDAMRRDFVANVSHELRTPVAAIRALVETIQLRGARRPELVGEYAPRVAGECERLDRLVQDLLLLAETESGGLRLKLEAVDPQEVAEEVGRLLAPVLEGGRVRLCLGPGAGVLVRADRRALEQCLRNLVENAVRYAPEGEITVSSRAEGAHVVLSVVDQGPGIPPEALPRIFERFYRVDQARTREAGSLPGSGLGLAIVRHLVEVQGGRVWVESVVGKGSRFHLELPRALPAEPAEQGTGS